MGNPFESDDINTTTTIVLRGIGMNHSTWRTRHGSKTVYFIRHAEAEHNSRPTPDYTLRDPRLTSAGVLQAQRIRDAIPLDAFANVQLIVTSPMQRAIQTCLYAFRSQIDWGNVRMELLGDLQETSLMPCDKGSSKEQLREWFPEFDGQLNALADGWEEKSACDCQPEALSERSRRVMEWLMARPEQVIVCVTHNGFLRHLLGQNLWSEQGERPMGFANAEVRRLVLHREPAVKHDDDDDDDGSGERNSQRQFRLTKSGIVIIDRTFSNEIAEIGHLD